MDYQLKQSIDSRCVKFSKSPLFRERVCEILNNQILWHDIIQHLNLNTLINDRVDFLVKQEVNTIVPPLVKSEIDKYAMYTLPTQVNTLLSNSPIMQQILQSHSNQLNTELESTARKFLTRLVNEDQYHDMTKSYLTSCRSRFDKFTEQCNDSVTDTLTSVQYMVDQKVQRIETLEQTVANQETQIQELQYYTCSLGFMVFVSLGGLTALLLSGPSRH